MLKGRKSRLISGIVAVGLIVGCLTVFAKQSEEVIGILYSNIKIMIDGVEYTPKDANGYPVEPFIYNGTTYLPVRGIANAFGSSVNWDPTTSTVSLGKSKFDWLDQMGYVDYYTDSNSNSFSIYSDDTFNRAIKGNMDSGYNFYKNLKSGDIAKQKVTYKISKKYDQFYATLGSTGAIYAPVTLKIYGDNNKVLYMMSADSNSKPIDIIVDVSGNDFLYFETNVAVGDYTNGDGGNIILGNARFSLAE